MIPSSPVTDRWGGCRAEEGKIIHQVGHIGYVNRTTPVNITLFWAWRHRATKEQIVNQPGHVGDIEPHVVVHVPANPVVVATASCVTKHKWAVGEWNVVNCGQVGVVSMVIHHCFDGSRISDPPPIISRIDHSCRIITRRYVESILTIIHDITFLHRTRRCEYCPSPACMSINPA